MRRASRWGEELWTLSDWRQWVHLRLARAGLRLPIEDQAVEELANHIEDSLCDSQSSEQGNGPGVLRSKFEKEDWSGLAREIHARDQHGAGLRNRDGLAARERMAGGEFGERLLHARLTLRIERHEQHRLTLVVHRCVCNNLAAASERFFTDENKAID